MQIIVCKLVHLLLATGNIATKPKPGAVAGTAKMLRHAGRIMKLTAILILGACLQIHATGLGQGITLNAKEAPIETVIKQIQKQTSYKFLYTSQLLAEASPITISVRSADIKSVLDQVLKNQKLEYELNDKIIVIRPKHSKEDQLSLGASLAGPIDITGKVTNNEGQSLAGANVKIHGTNIGVTTDVNGNFALKNISENAVLEVTFIGYEMKTFTVHKAGFVNIALGKKISLLDETVVIAYGTTSKRFLTGNVHGVKATDIEKQPVQNPLLALQGRVPGLVITQNSGVPGGGITVRIQGQNSIQNGNDPLYIVDGVPVPSQLAGNALGGVLGESGTSGSKGNPLNYLDINSIESIEVLKDADATAIYGSRAANGAILITTKKGKIGRTSFDLNLQAGVGKLKRSLKMMNTRQYLDMRYEALKNDGISLSSLNQNADYDLTVWDTARYTDWQKELLGGAAKYQNANATLQGGTATMQYRISGNYHKETTVFQGDFNDEKAAMQFAITNKSLNGKFNLVFSGSYLWDKNKLPFVDLTQTAIALAPNAPSMHNEDGAINWVPNSSGISTFTINPSIYNYQKFESITGNLISSFTASYSLFKDFILKANFGYNQLRSDDFIGNPLVIVRPENRSNPQQRFAYYTDRRQISWNVEPQVCYNRNINNHRFDLLTGVTFNSATSNAGSITGYDHLSDALIRNRAAASTFVALNQTMIDYRYNAIFGRFTYNYLNKYIASVNGRRDGSSRFGTENKFANFYSISGAWIFTEESVFKKFSKILSFGKIKCSYGSTGSDQVPDYNFLSLYSLQTIANRVLYQGIRGLQPSGLPNPYLEWEKTIKFNTGIDIGLFDNRYFININYGINRSSNQLLKYALASSAGFEEITSNFPAMVENTSWEFILTTTNIKKHDFLWTSSINLTVPKNRIVEFPNLESSSYANRVVVGQPLNISRLYNFAGINTTTGTYQFYDKDGGVTESPINEDRTIYININPKFYGGFENSIKYKSFQLDFHFQFVKQFGPNFLFHNGAGTVPGRFSGGAASSNQPISVLARWQKPGDESRVQKFTTSSNAILKLNTAKLSNEGISDASYIRVKNISFSYIVPQVVSKSIGLNSGRIFFQAQNILTITNYKGLDPENQSSTALPPLQLMTFGIQISF